MTRLGHTELSKDMQQKLARLMQLHRLTHPKRIAPLFGVGAQYMRQLWREQEMAPLKDVLELLK